MNDDIYKKMAKILDTLPNGFPATDSGIEIKILKKIFTPEEADLFCDLKLTPETAEKIASRTGRPLEGLEDMLTLMWERGEVFGTEIKGVKKFNMIPWIVGIYEFQLHRMDKEFAEMVEEYGMYWGMQFLQTGPQMMQVLPIEEEIPTKHEAMPYEQVSHIIENGNAFLVNECICKKKQGLLDKPCDKPLEVCLAISAEPGAFDKADVGRVLSKEKAYELLNKCEEAGLVHLTSNIKQGHYFICNCCGCCCGLLQAAKMGVPNVTNAHYYAVIDPDECTACGICLDERCQIDAIKEGDDAYQVIQDKCIGCGLCITTCPTEAISLKRKQEKDIIAPVLDEASWYKEKGRQRNVDFSKYE